MNDHLSQSLFQENLDRFTHIAAEAVATKRESSAVHVIFVASRDGGAIRKLSHDPKTRRTCLVELLLPFERRDNAAAIRDETRVFHKLFQYDSRIVEFEYL